MAFSSSARIAVSLLAGAVLVTPAMAADWSDTSIGVSYGNDYREPFNPDKISKVVYNLGHVSGDRWGTNLITLDVLVSDKHDPALNSKGGAVEFYGFYQRTLSLNALSGGNAFTTPFTKDVSLSARVDMGSKNSAVAPRPRKLRLGLQAALPVEKGFWNVGLDWYQESSNNALSGAGNFTYDHTWAASTAWAIPVGPGTFGGFFDVIGKKGTHGGPGFAKTGIETMLQASYMVPVGGGFDLGVGYEFRGNKYGNDNGLDPFGGSEHSTGLLLARYHF